METSKLLTMNANATSIDQIFSAIEQLIPAYMNDIKDSAISGGNVAVCIIDEQGNIHGKLFGNDKIRQRQSFSVAWKKASQVWITGMKTGEFEKLVFNGSLDYHKFGIEMPDFIGWQGGQPVMLNNNLKLSVGFSGFRGVTDIEIVLKAISMAGLG